MFLRRSGWVLVPLVCFVATACQRQLRYRTPSEGPLPAKSLRGETASPAQQPGGVPGASARAEQDLRSAIRRSIDGDPGIGAHHVDVAVDDGVVTLTGSVRSGPALERVLRSAELKRGVIAVVNRLQVVAPSVADTEIAAAVRDALRADPATHSGRIDVVVHGGALTLSGEMDTAAQKAVAAELAWSVRGVSAVDNRIELRASIWRPDAEIQRELKRRFGVHAELHDQPISVHVEAANVVLKGSVLSALQKRRAGEAARVAGVRAVDDSALRVDPAGRSAALLEPSDEQMEAAVSDQLRHDPRLKEAPISTRAQRGKVTLTGSVVSLRAKLAAEQAALATTGVWEVENALEVRADLDADDAELASRARERLRHDAVAGAHQLSIEVSGARAVLRGEVTSHYESARAELAVASVPGVVAIDNGLVALQPEPPADDVIQDDIESRLFWDSRVDASKISVAVRDGVVFLRGEVASRSAYDAVIESAFAARPREIVTGLRRAFVVSGS